ncbi:AI-2E family transporter [Actinorugispora endophytica]|uniref:Putative PurR-regulated permease PerM n=1 Tax=Actinorugispora endophytica TaxID=1605990 RepID=A0A4R6USL3_9ACTN|nr:AI-2E family transporter [Actinorugispora endophytica]TDQ50278.1 putative PurR-regulated permease PerM [Actinorugispora endophytica]
MFDRLRAALGVHRSGGEDAPSPQPPDRPPAAPPSATTATTTTTENTGSVRVGLAASIVARWSLRALAIAAALYIAGWLVQQTWSLLLPLVLALLLSTILWPLMQALRRLMPSALAALISMLGFLAVLTGIVWVIVPRVSAEAGELIDQLYEAVDDFRGFLGGPPLNLDSDQVADMLDQALNQLQQHQQAIATSLLTGVSSLGSFLVNFVLVLFLTFFVLKDGPRFLPWSHRWLPDRGRGHVDALAVRIWKTLTGFIWSQAAVAFVDAVLIGTGLVILDIPFALPITVAIFFASFIPIVGAIATGILATLVALIDQGFLIALLVLAIVLVVQQLEGNLLQPFLVGRTLSLHPAVVLGAVTVGGTIFGIIGAFLAVPAAGTAITALRYAREQAVRQPSGPAAEPMPGPAPEKRDEAAQAPGEEP